jgi:hypothetical protein
MAGRQWPPDTTDLDYHGAMGPLVLALWLAAPPVPSPAAGGVVIERVVAVVRNPASAAPRPLTLTRLDDEARVALVGQGAAQAAFAPLDAAARRAALHWLLDQWLVADEATRLKVDEVPREEIQKALLGFRERFADEETYRRFLATTELTEGELQSILARGLRVQRFLDSRLGRGGRVSEDEVSRWLAGQGSAAPTAAERDAARARLVSDRAQGQVKQILGDLRSRADIRVLVKELRGEPER